jgi:hypothetical protein
MAMAGVVAMTALIVGTTLLTAVGSFAPRIADAQFRIPLNAIARIGLHSLQLAEIMADSLKSTGKMDLGRVLSSRERGNAS